MACMSAHIAHNVYNTCVLFQDGRTPLMLACIKGKEKMVNLLIDHGADVQAMDKVTITYEQAINLFYSSYPRKEKHA